MPTYNRASTLRQTIRTVLSQTYTDFELIVCDDASSDNTQNVVRGFTDGRIRYLRNERNLGLYPNFNRCLDLAAGELIAIYHDHDLYMPTIVERSVELLQRHPSASFVHSAVLLIAEDNAPVGVDIRQFPELMTGRELRCAIAETWHSPVTLAVAMVRREAYAQIGRYEYERYGLGCDLHTWFLLAGIGDVAYVNDPQAFVRTRRRGDPTATFCWSSIAGSLRMRQDHLAAIRYECRGMWRRFLLHALQRDTRLLWLMARCVCLEPGHVVDEGYEIIRLHAGWGVLLLAGLMKRSRTLQAILRQYGLPHHYRRIDRWAARQKQATAQYLAAHPDLLLYLNKAANGDATP
jgi:glycosyltransferase involved in cell wall biosynthesis